MPKIVRRALELQSKLGAELRTGYLDLFRQASRPRSTVPLPVFHRREAVCVRQVMNTRRKTGVPTLGMLVAFMLHARSTL